MRRSLVLMPALYPAQVALRTLHVSSRSSDGDSNAEQAASTATDSVPAGRLLDLFAPERMRLDGPSGSSTGHASMHANDEDAGPSEQLNQQDVVQIMIRAVRNVAPLMKVQSIRAGTRVVHVPKVVMPAEQRSLAVR